MFFRLSDWQLALIVFAVVFGATLLGHAAGRYLRKHGDSLHAPIGVIQGALLGLVGLILAFGLSLAVGRYEQRRAAVVNEANAIGTTYLRAETLAEPMRSRSLALFRPYANTSIHLSKTIPGSPAMRATIARSESLQHELWGLAGQALNKAPLASAPRLYAESMNEMFDAQSSRVAALNNRVPGAVLGVEVIGAMLALALLALYLAILGRGVTTVLIAGGLIGLLLLVTFDLDRPTRGLIRIPSTPLVAVRAEMSLPPAAHP